MRNRPAEIRDLSAGGDASGWNIGVGIGMLDHFDVIIIGCGIVEASAAYFLAQRGMGNLLVLEGETQPG